MWGRDKASVRVGSVMCLGKLVECITVDYIVQGTFARFHAPCCRLCKREDLFVQIPKPCNALNPQGLVLTSQNPKNYFPPH